MSQIQRTALITGSGRNIGRAAALVLAKQSMNIVVNGSSNQDACEIVANEVREIGPKAIVVMGDVGDINALQNITSEAEKAFGRVDVLVNNAAVRPNSPFLETDDDEWARILDIDFHAARRLAKACLPANRPTTR